jgi:predicted GH43/DUF377 family glycosyl hydrolase
VSFLSQLTDIAEDNQARWERSPDNPVLPFGESWCREFIGPSSVLLDEDTLELYAEGGADDREAIGRYRVPLGAAFGAAWVADPHNPLLRPRHEGFDRGSVFDPAAVWFRGRKHVYYSATAGGAHAFAESADPASGLIADDHAPEDETIGHAVATTSGLGADPRPVLEGRCPFAIEVDDELFLFYVKVAAGGYRIYSSRSTDGTTFSPIGAGPVLDIGAPGQWDSYTVTTPKVFADGDRFIMIYSGDDRSLDDPTGIGVAVSDDLVRWAKHPGNPIMRPGPAGSFDCRTVASAVPFHAEGRWHVLYAGAASPVALGLRSQIGMARLRPR